MKFKKSELLASPWTISWMRQKNLIFTEFSYFIALKLSKMCSPYQVHWGRHWQRCIHERCSRCTESLARLTLSLWNRWDNPFPEFYEARATYLSHDNHKRWWIVWGNLPRTTSALSAAVPLCTAIVCLWSYCYSNCPSTFISLTKPTSTTKLRHLKFSLLFQVCKC